MLWITESVANTATVNPNSVKTLLVNGFIKGNLVFSNGSRSLPKNHSDCINIIQLKFW